MRAATVITFRKLKGAGFCRNSLVLSLTSKNRSLLKNYFTLIIDKESRKKWILLKFSPNELTKCLNIYECCLLFSRLNDASLTIVWMVGIGSWFVLVLFLNGRDRDLPDLALCRLLPNHRLLFLPSLPRSRLPLSCTRSRIVLWLL